MAIARRVGVQRPELVRIAVVDSLPLPEEAKPAAAEAPPKTEVSAAPPATDAPPIEPINYDVEPAPVTGVIRGLAETIPAKGTLLLAIAKLESGELLVTIQPPKTEKDGDPALPLQVKGTPTEIDAQLVDALAHYVPARKITRPAA